MSEIWFWPLILLAYPVYVLAMSLVLRLIGVPKHDVVSWALRQADRQRLTDLAHAARRLPAAAGERPDGPA
jgi:hypothetical protein